MLNNADEAEAIVIDTKVAKLGGENNDIHLY